MAQELPRPDRDRLSTLAALVVLTFTLLRVTSLPTAGWEIAIAGLQVRLEINTTVVMLALAAGLAVAGADWLLEGHPSAQGRRRVEHWVLPGLAAFGLGMIVARLPDGPPLWLGLVACATGLVAALYAEFLAVDPADPRRDLAAIGLHGLGHLLLLQVAFALRALGMRAAFQVPLLFLTVAAVLWRLLCLQGDRTQAPRHALLGAWITAQVGWGLHYWPVRPLTSALFIALVAYLAQGASLDLQQGNALRDRWPEYAGVSALAIVAIALAR